MSYELLKGFVSDTKPKPKLSDMMFATMLPRDMRLLNYVENKIAPNVPPITEMMYTKLSFLPGRKYIKVVYDKSDVAGVMVYTKVDSIVEVNVLGVLPGFEDINLEEYMIKYIKTTEQATKSGIDYIVLTFNPPGKDVNQLRANGFYTDIKGRDFLKLNCSAGE